MTPQNKVHSSAYYLMMTIAVVVGIALGIGIFVWISMNATGRVRFPIYLLILPTILLVGLVRFIDGALVKRRQASSGLANQDMTPLASPYGQPNSSVEYGQQPPQMGGPAPYGQAQQPGAPAAAAYGQAQPTAPAAAGYGQAQQTGAPAAAAYGQAQPTAPAAAGYGQAQPTAPAAPGYGQAQQTSTTAPTYGQAQQPVPGSGSGYGRPATGYSQTPQTDAQSPYGQNGSQIG